MAELAVRRWQEPKRKRATNDIADQDESNTRGERELSFQDAPKAAIGVNHKKDVPLGIRA